MGRCAAHARQRDRATHLRKSFYNSKRWAITRRTQLFNHPLCQCGCGRVATDVHHIRDIEQGGDPWSLDNLESLTHECHARITRARQQGAATT